MRKKTPPQQNDLIILFVCVCALQAENDYLNDINTECYQRIQIAIGYRLAVEYIYNSDSRSHTTASECCMFNFHFQLNRSCQIIVIIIWYWIISLFPSLFSHWISLTILFNIYASWIATTFSCRHLLYFLCHFISIFNNFVCYDADSGRWQGENICCNITRCQLCT